MNKPKVLIIAGPNGAGKTTAAPALLQDTVHIYNFVNADIIAQGLCGFQPENVAIQAGRIMLNRINELANSRENFAFETTLASRTFSILISKMKKNGYQFNLTFLWLASDELAVSRVKERVKSGGHIVPEPTIRRRYQAGLHNFFNLYRPIADSWQLYNNSNPSELSLIASGATDSQLTVNNHSIWSKLLERYHGR